MLSFARRIAAVALALSATGALALAVRGVSKRRRIDALLGNREIDISTAPLGAGSGLAAVSLHANWNGRWQLGAPSGKHVHAGVVVFSAELHGSAEGPSTTDVPVWWVREQSAQIHVLSPSSQMIGEGLDDTRMGLHAILDALHGDTVCVRLSGRRHGRREKVRFTVVGASSFYRSVVVGRGFADVVGPPNRKRARSGWLEVASSDSRFCLHELPEHIRELLNKQLAANQR